MDFTVEAFDLAKSRMLSAFNEALADAEVGSKTGMQGAVKNSAAPTVENASRILAASPAGAIPASAVALAGK